MKQNKPHKPRDPYFAAMKQRKSGAHVKSKKALRMAEKMKIRRDYDV